MRGPATEHHVQAVSSRLGQGDKIPCRSDVCGTKQGAGARAWIAGEPPQKKDAGNDMSTGYCMQGIRSCNRAIALGGLSPQVTV